GPFSTIKLNDVPEPTLLSDQWVKVKTRVCGYCGSDQSLIFLKDSPTASPFTSFPCIIGHEISGEIVETGTAVKTLKKGDRIAIAPHLNCVTRGIKELCNACRNGDVGSCENVAKGDFSAGMFIGICKDIGGGFAPTMIAHESQVFKLPDSITFKEGALIEPLTVGLQAVWNNRPHPDDEILVIGGGVIGTMVIQAIRGLGIDCRITVAEPSAFHADLSKKVGADKIISNGDIYSAATEISGAERYKPLLGNDILMGGYNKVFDTVGTSETLNLAMRCMAVRGVLSIIGIGHDVKLDLTPLWLKLQTLKGVYSYGYIDVGGVTKHIYEVAIDLIIQKKVTLSDLVTHTFPLDHFDKMIELNMAKGRHQAIKTAIAFD
ncbi:alcohol dehydrogenase catalytic domain-containing protein, partial [bacterium]|nr:alcohol dehydrogenase catalytic domain-containing protein [bacterium]